MTTLATPPMPVRKGMPTRPKVPPGPISYEQYLSDPDIEPHTEWVDGEVIPMPAVYADQAHEEMFLATLFKVYVDDRKLGIVLREPFQMKTAPDLPGRAPDIFFVANRNRSRIHGLFLEGPADLVVEIVSPGSQTRDRVHKFGEYQRGGVPEYWLVDPDRRTADFFRRGRNGLYKPVSPDRDGIYRCKAVRGLWIDVGWLWRRPLPSTVDVLKAWGIV